MRVIEKILILTDHSLHSASNSLYSLADAFSTNKQIEKVDIGSRGLVSNKGFFEGQSDGSLTIINYKQGQDFDDLKDKWEQNTLQSHISDYDLILLRVPRPVSDEFFIFLEDHFDPKYIINRPSGIKKTGSKEFLLQFPELSVPMKLVKTVEEALELSRKMDIVLKPLEDYGGKGLLKIKGDQLWKGNEEVELSKLSENFDHENGMLAMKYLSRVSRGDKRIIVSNGKIMVSTIRYPAKDSWLCNVAQGGSSEMAQPSPHEKKIAEQISPVLKEHGVIFYGFDTLLSDKGKRVLSEINTLSIGGIAPAEENSGRKIAPLIVKGIFKHINQL